jgi:hypothetical protein
VVALVFLGWDVPEEAVEPVVVIPADPVEDDLLDLWQAFQQAGAERCRSQLFAGDKDGFVGLALSTIGEVCRAFAVSPC